MPHDVIRRMKQDFISDASETVGKIARSLSAFESSKPPVQSQIDWLFRTAHSLKGTSAMFELRDVARVAESMENVLEGVRARDLKLDDKVVDLLTEATAELGVLLRKAKGEEVTEDPDRVVEKINLFLGSTTHPGNSTAASEGATLQDKRPVRKATGARPKEEALSDGPTPKPEGLSVKVDISLLDSIMNTISELLSIRVELLGLAGKLAQNDETRRLRDDLLKLNLRLNKRISDLETSVVEARLVPIATLFDRYLLEVGRLAGRAGKKVRLVVEGEGTRMDRALLDHLYDPLLHLVRNAIDHGIEPPEERIRKKKPEKATIVIRAMQESNHVRIDIEDDGAGIDLEEVRAVAQRRGITPEGPESLLALLFTPGFTTKDVAGEISGRGVGLDAVKSQIEDLRGSLTIDTEPNQGTRFSIWVPLTLAVSRGMLIEESGIPVVIPLGCVIGALRLTRELHGVVEDTGRFKYKGAEMASAKLSRMLHVRRPETPGSAIIVGIGEKKLAIVTQRVCGDTEIVSRPLPKTMKVPRFITGSSELHDGRAAIIIQPEEILRTGYSQAGRPAGADLAVPGTPLLRNERKGKTIIRLLLFRAGDGAYAVPFYLLKEVVGRRCVTDVPILGDCWSGLFFIRGICHGLLKIPDLQATEAGSFDRIILLQSPDRCGLGASEIIGDFRVPLEAVDITSAKPASKPIEILGRLKWKGHEANVVDIAQGLRRSLSRCAGKARTEPSRQSEPLMRTQ